MNNVAGDDLGRNVQEYRRRLLIDELAAKTLKQGIESLVEFFTQLIDNVGRCLDINMNVLEIRVVEDFGDSFSGSSLPCHLRRQGGSESPRGEMDRRSRSRGHQLSCGYESRHGLADAFLGSVRRQPIE